MAEVVIGKKETNIPVTDTLSTVFESGNIAEYQSLTLWAYNTGNEAIVEANIEVSPDNETFYMFNNLKFALTGGAKDFLKMEGFPFFRIRMKCASGKSTTVTLGFTVHGSE